jgi:AcrR family transcriptional regulator
MIRRRVLSGSSEDTPASPRRRVGRPPRSPERTDEIRAAIVEAARRLFDREGYEAVSMRRIAEECGLATATLYSLFQSKRDLLRNVWDDVFARLIADCEAAASVEGSPLERLQAFGRLYVDHWIAHPDDFRVVFLIEDPAGSADDYYVDSSRVLSHFEAITAAFRAAVASRALPRRTDPTMVAQAYFCVLQGLAGSLITIPEFPWVDRAALIDTALACFLQGVRHGPPLSSRAPHSSRARKGSPQ